MLFNEKYKSFKDLFEQFMHDELDEILKEVPTRLKESMLYSLNGAGKRIRPVLFLSICANYEEIERKHLLFALAIEVLHNYSLVHDDLPCMDNDDYRRGRLTVHKVFGEDIAVLCGDSLLNLAYELATCSVRICKNLSLGLSALEYFTSLCGASGLIGGQVVDIDPNKQTSRKVLDYVYKNKTGALFSVSCACACLICGDDNELAKEFGYDIGKLFQITDDLLDNDDDFNIKQVCTSSEIDAMFNQTYIECKRKAELIDKDGFLSELVDFVAKRSI